MLCHHKLQIIHRMSPELNGPLPAASVVVPIDKLSILVTVAFSGIVFRERLSPKAGLGLASIVAGTMLMLF